MIEAIAFARWIFENDYYPVYQDKMWSDKDHNRIAKTIEGLYQIFKKETNG